MPRYSWPKGKSGNPNGRPPGTAADVKEWFKRLRIAAHRKVKIGEDGKPVLVAVQGRQEIDRLTVAADKVLELACEGNLGGRAHREPLRRQGEGAGRADPQPQLKIKYESYEEARAALLEEGINIDRLPMLTDMRIPEGQDRS